MTSYNALVIEDDPEIQELICLRLGELGLECKKAATAKEAMLLLHHELFDVAIVDIGLPDMSGLDLLEKLQFLFQETNVIVVSAYNEAELAVKAVKLGALDYFVKPIDFRKLLSTIERAVFNIEAYLKDKQTPVSNSEGLESDLAKLDLIASGLRGILGSEPDNELEVRARTAITARKLGVSKKTIAQWNKTRYP